MKAQSIFTVFAITAAFALPACSSHKPTSEIKTDRQVVSGDPATGNYVEVVTETGKNYSKKTTVTHTVTKTPIPAGVKINPNVTTRTIQETNVRKITKDGKTKVEKSSNSSHTVTPVTPLTPAPAAAVTK